MILYASIMKLFLTTCEGMFYLIFPNQGLTVTVVITPCKNQDKVYQHPDTATAKRQ